MTWTDPSTLNTDPDDPVTSELMTALKNNVEAFANADSGAPSVGPAIAAITPGDVGSLVWARLSSGSGSKDYGDTTPGSNLEPSSVWADNGTDTPDGVVGDTVYSPVVARAVTPSVALSGTWTCLGWAPTDGSSYPFTLWLRTL